MSIAEEKEYFTMEEVFLYTEEEKPSVYLRGSKCREDLTQKELSEHTGIPIRHISEMENGKRPIGKKNATKLAEVLNCNVSSLITIDNTLSPSLSYIFINQLASYFVDGEERITGAFLQDMLYSGEVRFYPQDSDEFIDLSDTTKNDFEKGMLIPNFIEIHGVINDDNNTYRVSMQDAKEYLMRKSFKFKRGQREKWDNDSLSQNKEKKSKTVVNVQQAWYIGKPTALEQMEALQAKNIPREVIAALIYVKGKRGFGAYTIGRLFCTDKDSKDEKHYKRKTNQLVAHADKYYNIKLV